MKKRNKFVLGFLVFFLIIVFVWAITSSNKYIDNEVSLEEMPEAQHTIASHPPTKDFICLEAVGDFCIHGYNEACHYLGSPKGEKVIRLCS